MKKIAAFILFIGVLNSISAQSTLTLDSCRALALSNNKELRISAEKITAAHYEKKAAFTNYLPKIAAIGTYMHTQKEISLLSDEQKGAISQIGTTAQGSIRKLSNNWQLPIPNSHKYCNHLLPSSQVLEMH